MTSSWSDMTKAPSRLFPISSFSGLFFSPLLTLVGHRYKRDKSLEAVLCCDHRY